MSKLNHGAILEERMAPLISCQTIFDLDYGLIRLVYDQYYDHNVFKEEYSEMNTRRLVSILYGRDDKNPLYIIAKENVSHDLLDQYYGEFLLAKRKEIYEHCISTSILGMIQSFKSSQIIKPCILCYDDLDVAYVKDEPDLDKCRIVMSQDICSDDNLNTITAYFFKDVSEVIPLKDKAKLKSIYISSYGPNLKDGDLVEPELITNLAINKNQIDLFDFYNGYILGGNHA